MKGAKGFQILSTSWLVLSYVVTLPNRLDRLSDDALLVAYGLGERDASAAIVICPSLVTRSLTRPTNWSLADSTATTDRSCCVTRQPARHVTPIWRRSPRWPTN
jgi:hypothetical protein